MTAFDSEQFLKTWSCQNDLWALLKPELKELYCHVTNKEIRDPCVTKLRTKKEVIQQLNMIIKPIGEVSDKENLNNFELLIQGYRNIPENLSEYQKSKIKTKLIEKFPVNYSQLSDFSVENVLGKKLDTSGLNELTKENQFSFTDILAPPTMQCLLCGENLTQVAKDQTIVVLFDLDGPRLATSYAYRCRHHEQEITYKPTMWGNSLDGFAFYEQCPDFVKASNCVYLSSSLCELSETLAHHVWASHVGKAEALNEMWRETNPEKINIVKTYFNSRESSSHDGDEDGTHECDEDRMNSDSDRNFCGRHEITRKNLSSACWTYNVRQELLEMNALRNYRFQGNLKCSFKQFMEGINKSRESQLYKHVECNPDCKKRGCGVAFSADGLWKLRHPHCMWYTKSKLFNKIGGHCPPVCTEEPIPTTGFCKHHAELVKKQDMPIGVSEFIRACGINPEAYTKTSAELVSEILKALAEDVQEEPGTMQGNIQIVEDLVLNENVNEDMFDQSETGDLQGPCNKDTGGHVTLQKWSRGLFCVVRGGGHIDYFSPLYKSESPSQAGLAMLTFLILYVVENKIPKDEWKNLFLLYDNMCNVDGMSIFSTTLPLNDDLSSIWQDVNKCIDKLHLKNHARESCHIKYNPNKLKDILPEANTMCAEQTFCWLGLFDLNYYIRI